MNRPPGHVRVIAGRLRGSKLPVADLPGLRPTGDRARETLFNWLQQEVAGRQALDLFAGSGALGFEAASRGAAHVLLLEREPRLAASLRESAARLHADDAIEVECADALAWLGKPARARFDLAFLDPPFDAGLHEAAARALQPWLAPRAWVYVELAKSASFEPPPGWRLHRENATKEARHLLFRVESEAGAGTLDGTLPGPGTPPA